MHNEIELKSLQQIYRDGEATRADLMEALGLSQASVVRLVADLRSRGLLAEKQTALPAGRGRPSNVFGINPEAGYVAGIEFGRDHLTVGLLAADGSVVGWQMVEEPPPFTASDATMEAVAAEVFRAAGLMNISTTAIRGIGLAVHGVVSQNADWLVWEQSTETFYPVQKFLSGKLGCLVHVEDVSRAFAEAEHRYGAGRGADDMVYLFVGRHGIGSGVFVNNTLLNSSLGICGEVGHITVRRGGLPCQCGNRGCLETVATHDAVVAEVRARLAEGVMSALPADDLSFAQVCQAYRDGDKLANIVLSGLGEDIATALSSTINIVGSTRVLIGGQLRLAGDGFLASLTNLLRQQIIPSLAQRLNVGYAELPAYAGAWGVAAQTLDAAWQAGSFLESKVTL